MFTSDPGVTAAAYSYFAWAGRPRVRVFRIGHLPLFRVAGRCQGRRSRAGGTARLLLVAVGGWWLVSIDAPAWTLFALVGAAMVVFGLGSAASVCPNVR